MRRFCKRALAVVTAAAMLSAGSSALAAEGDTGISVQLDGQTLTFSDAAPEARDGRTFLPVRAVFEAMGAQVSYDAAAGTVTAVRDGTTVTMTLGSTDASVSMDGITTPVVMDVAPYAHDNRTYVPVRFAAQAFGCIVGWDADDRTVILIDTEKLVEDTIAKYDYTLLEKYLAYGQTYSTGIWDMEAAFDAELALGVAPITMDGELTGTVADGMQMDAAMALRMDLQELLDSLTEGAGGRHERHRHRPAGQPGRRGHRHGHPRRSGARAALLPLRRRLHDHRPGRGREHLVLHGHGRHV